MIDRERLTSHLHREEDRAVLGHILDKVEIVLKRKSKELTNFLNPYECEIASGVIKQISEINYKLVGGYPDAERKRISIFPDFIFPDHVENPVSILKISGNFKFQAVSHRDFLGSILGTGIKREMIGDILVTDEFAQVIVAAELKDYIILNLEKVHEGPVEIEEISSEELVIPHSRIKEIKATVPSMRLDAVASAGFGDSRSRISREIQSEKVRVNYQPVNDPSVRVEVGDVISIRGRGRIKVAEINGVSNRDRIKLLIHRLI